MVVRILTRFKRLFSLFLYIVLLNGNAMAQDGLPQADFVEMRSIDQAEVVEVLGPLTILLSDGRIIRLSGIDVPGTFDEHVSEWAVTARNILRDMLLAQRVSVYQTQNRDLGRTNRMGQHLAHLERHSDKAWAQGTLLSLGLARVRTSQYNSDMADQMYDLEQAARDEKIGIWSSDNYALLSPEGTEGYIGKFAVVEGTPVSVASKNNRIYINFGKNWREDFTVTIPPSEKRAFSKAGLDPMNWGGQLMRVRGTLQSINGPSIETNHPEAIEILSGDGRRKSSTIRKTGGNTMHSIVNTPPSP